MPISVHGLAARLANNHTITTSQKLPVFAKLPIQRMEPNFGRGKADFRARCATRERRGLQDLEQHDLRIQPRRGGSFA